MTNKDIIYDYLYNQTKGKNNSFSTLEISKACMLSRSTTYKWLKKLYKEKKLWCGWENGPTKCNWSAELTCLYCAVQSLWQNDQKHDAILTLIKMNKDDDRIILSYDEAKTYLENNLK